MGVRAQSKTGFTPLCSSTNASLQTFLLKLKSRWRRTLRRRECTCTREETRGGTVNCLSMLLAVAPIYSAHLQKTHTRGCCATTACRPRARTNRLRRIIQPAVLGVAHGVCEGHTGPRCEGAKMGGWLEAACSFSAHTPHVPFSPPLAAPQHRKTLWHARTCKRECTQPRLSAPHLPN
jgi:hypothetical protein